MIPWSRESLLILNIIENVFTDKNINIQSAQLVLAPSPSPSWPLIMLWELRLMAARCRSDGAQSHSGSVRAQSETGSSGGRKVNI